MFKSTQRNFKVEHPEIATYKEFSNLTDEEYQFVWNFANKTSEFAHIKNKRSRAAESYAAAFTMPHPQKEKLIVGDFPEVIDTAIKKMAQFNPDIRGRAKNSLMAVFANYEKVMNMDVDMTVSVEEDEGEEKPKRKKKTNISEYVDSTKKIVEGIPNLIRLIEEGFGIKEGKKEENLTADYTLEHLGDN